MKRRLDRIVLAAFAVLMVGAGIANLLHAALLGEIRGKRGWISYAEHPSWFLFYVAASAAGALLFAAGLYLGWRDHRAFASHAARQRPPLDEARRRGADRR